MKHHRKPHEVGWNNEEHSGSTFPTAVEENAIESASRSAVRRFSLLSSVSFFALAALVVPFEIDTDRYLPTISIALADGDESGGGEDGEDGEDGESGGDGGESGGNDGEDGEDAGRGEDECEAFLDWIDASLDCPTEPGA